MRFLSFIFSILLVETLISPNLSAGPIYAAKWKCGNQTVLLYGDWHDTNKKDLAQENRSIAAFYRELESVRRKTLVLFEDLAHPLCCAFLTREENEIYHGNQNDRGFMGTVSSFAHLANTNAQPVNFYAQSIEPRIECNFICKSICYYAALHNLILNEKSFLIPRSSMIVYDRIYEQIKDGSIAGCFELPITNAKLYAEFTREDRAKDIFTTIAQTLADRKNLLWQKISAGTELSVDELNEVTVGAMLTRMTSDVRYAKLADFFLQYEDNLCGSYALESLDSEALWHIVEAKDYYQKMIVIAGAVHIANIEEYLSKLEFVKEEDIVTVPFVKILNEFEEAAVEFFNLLELPINFGNWFEINLFTDMAQKKLTTMDEHSLPENIVLALQKFKQKKLALNNLENQMPCLVPFETFKWINEVN